MFILLKKNHRLGPHENNLGNANVNISCDTYAVGVWGCFCDVFFFFLLWLVGWFVGKTVWVPAAVLVNYS